ncbi:large exoprotein [Microbacterium sp. EF45047]|uniref:large exoprotein n=1 Tax=Microbacterium sp. EF45047 TaxID=2809708 RepID=UPI00234AA02E|nr:large exoprotein [Microbacterium sp. EF45047]
MYDDYDGSYAAFFAVYFFVLFLMVVVGYVLTSLFLMKIFEKAGVQGKWRAWVPFYNFMVFFKLGDLSPWLAFGFLLTWIPVLGWLVGIAMVVVSALAAWRVGLKLQKEAVWVVLWVLLSIVWLGINAFDKSRWNPNIAPAPWAGNGFLADRTVWEGVPVQPSAAGPAAPGYGAAPQGYAPPQGYGTPNTPPAPPAPGTPSAPGAGAPGGPAVPPPPSTPPAPNTPPAPPSAPPAAPPAPPAPPTDPNRPPA